MSDFFSLKVRKPFIVLGLIALTIAVLMFLNGCERSSFGNNGEPVQATQTGVKQVILDKEDIKLNSEGMTAEQLNIRDKLRFDNQVGAVKHLYIVSAFTGEVVIYSPVRGKVTSSKKRLTPTTVAAGITRSGDFSVTRYGAEVTVNGEKYLTPELIQDDGTFGSSGEYLYWTDTAGNFHKQYITGGVLIHVSSKPMRFPKIILDLSVDSSGSSTDLTGSEK